MRVKVNGEIVMSDDKWLYDWCELENTAPSDIRRALEDLPEGEELVLEINSGGGVVMAGFEIYSLLRQSGRRVVAEVQSYAASAASTILQGCTVRRMSPVGQVMIHNPSCTAWGNAAALGQAVQMLEAGKESILNAYELRSGGKCSREELSRLMDEERWMSAQEAVERGLADEIVTQTDEGAPVWAATLRNAAGGADIGTLRQRYEQLVRSGAREADPLHPVPPADGGAAASQGKSDPPAQGAEDHTGIRWQDEAWLDLERRKTIRL